MHFIEKLFQIAPDGGNGLTELAIVLALFCWGVVRIFRRINADRLSRR
jgi:hypothetical protein